MFKFSNDTFYKRHQLELEKYIYKKKSLHIVNLKSKNKILLETTNTIYLDLNNNSHLDELSMFDKYDVVLFTDVLENHQDMFKLLNLTREILNIDGKIIVSSVNSKFKFLIKFLEILNLKDSNLINNNIQTKKIYNLANGIGLEIQKYYTKQLFPFKFFNLGNLLNKLLESILVYFNLGIKTYIILRNISSKKNVFSKSIIVPAKNEAGNLSELISRIPSFPNTEIIFAYGESKDETLKKMKEIIESEIRFTFKLVNQSGKGKANAVWEAFSVVDNDLVAILDADISVDPETLSDFFNIIEDNRADFVNGSRLIYTMEKNSMRALNKVGNKFFQFFIGKIIRVNLTDSLCGTKVFKKSYIDDLIFWQQNFNFKDPFGDFDLLFSAAYSGQKIIELPVSYKERRYGTTQISRFSDGYKLLIYLCKSFFEFNTSRNV